jgi:hypothetical protein
MKATSAALNLADKNKISPDSFLFGGFTYMQKNINQKDVLYYSKFQGVCSCGGGGGGTGAARCVRCRHLFGGTSHINAAIIERRDVQGAAVYLAAPHTSAQQKNNQNSWGVAAAAVGGVRHQHSQSGAMC